MIKNIINSIQLDFEVFETEFGVELFLLPIFMFNLNLK